MPNDKLLEVVPKGTTMLAALKVADDVLRQGIQGICDLVITPGLINLDLADVRTIMTNAGTGHMALPRPGAKTVHPVLLRWRSTRPCWRPL